MLSLLRASVRHRQLFVSLPRVNHLVLGTGILKHSANIANQRETGDHYQEERHSNQTVDQVESYRRANRMKPRSNPRPGVSVPGPASRMGVDCSAAQIHKQDICEKKRQDYEQQNVEEECKCDRTDCT